MIAACSKNEHAREALHLFYQMQIEDIKPNEDVVSWSSMIAACGQNEHSKEALDLFHQMRIDGINPDRVAFLCAVDACATSSDLKQGQEMHVAIVESGYDGDIIVATALVNMFGKCGDLDDAWNVFGRMPQRDVVSWSAMIAACAHNGHAKCALELFNQMQVAGVIPNKIAFFGSLEACANMAALEEGQEIHALLVANGYDQEVFMGNALITMYGKCANLHAARTVFGRMSQQNVISWNAMIGSYAQNGHNEKVLDLFHQMQLEGVKPDKITFISVLTACNHTGKVGEGRRIFFSMQRIYGITPSVEHCVCMIDLLGRSGDLDEAEDFIKVMPFEETSSAWASLLGACKFHGDIERGLRAAKQCMELDPSNAASYVTLWNLHAVAEKQTI